MPPSRLGWPQVFALLLLAAFVLQSCWLIHALPLRRAEAAYAQAGLDQLGGKILARDLGVLPIPAVLAALPGALPKSFLSPGRLRWYLRLPFLAVGWLLGASIWYVARRLYGNSGGYIALTLYCFSPAAFFCSPGPLLSGSLGIFGTVFVAIAAAHTLYAPPHSGWRELRSRWRRILLLGLAMALATGSGPWSVAVILLALVFMLYLVPERRLASSALFFCSCALAFVVLLACFGFRPRAFAAGMANAQLPSFEGGIISSEILRAYLTGIIRAVNPFLLLLAGICVLAWLGWGRCRYFGNSAPLLAALVITGLSLFAFADVLVGPFPWRAAPFVYVFMGGIFADLLESRWRNAAAILITGLLLGYAATAVLSIARLQPTFLP